MLGAYTPTEAQLAYEAGAKKINPQITVMANYVGITSEAWNNPPKGKELAVSQYDSGADIYNDIRWRQHHPGWNHQWRRRRDHRRRYWHPDSIGSEYLQRRHDS